MNGEGIADDLCSGDEQLTSTVASASVINAPETRVLPPEINLHVVGDRMTCVDSCNNAATVSVRSDRSLPRLDRASKMSATVE